MNMMFEMMNMPVVTSQYWNIAYGAGKGEVKPQKIPTVLWWGFTFSEIQALLEGFNLLFCGLRAALIVCGALEGRILHLRVELNLRLCT